MTVLGLDSAETTGYALVAREGGRERLLRYGTLQARTAADVEWAAAHLTTDAVDLVAVEEPFIHPKMPGSGLALARLLGRWLQAFEARGLATTTIPASMWQTRLLPGVFTRTRSADRKAAAIAFARDVFGVVVTADEADAIALAVYTVRNARVSAPARTPTAPTTAERSL